jgi:energy-coupling factor transport system permease protein
VLVLVIDAWQFSLACSWPSSCPCAVLGQARQIALALALTLGPLLVSSLVLHGVLPGGDDVLARWGPARVTAEGLEFAALMGLRLAVFAGVLLTAAMTVSIPELMSTLTHRGWNRKLIFVLGSAVGLLPHVTGRARQITRAQQARGSSSAQACAPGRGAC